jgi:hypothetical protein
MAPGKSVYVNTSRVTSAPNDRFDVARRELN